MYTILYINDDDTFVSKKNYHYFLKKCGNYTPYVAIHIISRVTEKIPSWCQSSKPVVKPDLTLYSSKHFGPIHDNWLSDIRYIPTYFKEIKGNIEELSCNNITFFMPFYDEPVFETYGPYYEFLHPIHLNPPSVLFESYLFKLITEIPETDYIGILTYKFPQKTNKTLKELININTEDKDIIVFFHKNCELLQQAEKSHGRKFTVLWKWLLNELSITVKPVHFCFFSNLWMMKRKHFVKYLKFVSHVISLLENIPSELAVILWSNSGYTGTVSKNELKDRYNIEHYPFHPFILERIIILFVHHFKLSSKYFNI